jgi:hypothetical protein
MCRAGPARTSLETHFIQTPNGESMIPTRVHGIIDYLTGVLLLAAPFIFGFAGGTAAQ